MAAITRTAVAAPSHRQPDERPAFRLIVGGKTALRRLHPSVYRRRRLLVLGGAVGLVLLLSVGLTMAAAPATDVGPAAGTAAAPGSASLYRIESGSPAGSYVVRPGDTLWSIARSLQPNGDIRGLVDDLARANGSVDLRPGELLIVPG